MKNYSNKNFSGKNTRKFKKNSDEKNYYSENLNSSKKNDRFSSNSFKNKNFNKINEIDKKKGNFSYSKRSKPTNKTNPISTKMNDGIVGKQNFFTPAPNANKITTIYNKDRYTQPVQMSKEQVEKH